jgi:anaerobic selenocysteine-containing dehydrogenase
MLKSHDAHGTLAEPRAIADGDLVIVYMAHDNMKAETVTQTGTFNGTYGNFQHRDWIGRPFGSRVRGRIHCVRVCRSLWSAAVMQCHVAAAPVQSQQICARMVYATFALADTQQQQILQPVAGIARCCCFAC